MLFIDWLRQLVAEYRRILAALKETPKVQSLHDLRPNLQALILEFHDPETKLEAYAVLLTRDERGRDLEIRSLRFEGIPESPEPIVAEAKGWPYINRSCGDEALYRVVPADATLMDFLLMAAEKAVNSLAVMKSNWSPGRAAEPLDPWGIEMRRIDDAAFSWSLSDDWRVCDPSKVAAHLLELDKPKDERQDEAPAPEPKHIYAAHQDREDLSIERLLALVLEHDAQRVLGPWYPFCWIAVSTPSDEIIPGWSAREGKPGDVDIMIGPLRFKSGEGPPPEIVEEIRRS